MIGKNLAAGNGAHLRHPIRETFVLNSNGQKIALMDSILHSNSLNAVPVGVGDFLIT